MKIDFSKIPFRKSHPKVKVLDVLPLLSQREKWRTAEGELVLIQNLSTSHKRNILAWLEKRAQVLWEADTHGFALSLDGPMGPSGEMAQDMANAEFDAQLRENPISWIRAQPLFIAIEDSLEFDLCA